MIKMFVQKGCQIRELKATLHIGAGRIKKINKISKKPGGLNGMEVNDVMLQFMITYLHSLNLTEGKYHV
jgi:hypothetical protein